MTRHGVALVGAMVLATSGCGSPPAARTTFLRSVDLVDMTDRMAQSIAHDDVLRQRNPDSDPWVISVDRVVNQTNQVIPEREKWLYVGRLRSLLAQSDFAGRYNLVWVIPPQRWPPVAEELDLEPEPFGLRMTPTHLLSAEFDALTNTSGAGRSDVYFCRFHLMDIRLGRLIWEDGWEVKRARSGLTYD
ncbi:MAG: hypothetical protein ACYS0G_11420 [Planctomycetota bacterium]